MLKKTRQLALYASSCIFAVSHGAFAAECSSPAWSSQTQYVGGEFVVYQNTEFKAKWWIKGSAPDKTERWGPWEFIKDCNTIALPEPSVSPVSRSFSKNQVPELTFNVDSDGDTLSRISLNGNNLTSSDYSINNTNLSFSSNYLATLPVGQHQHLLHFDTAGAIEINVIVNADNNETRYTLMPENATLGGNAIAQDSYINLAHGNVEWLYDSAQAGTFAITFYYNSPYGDKPNDVYINDNTQSFTASGGGELQALRLDNISLTANTNRIGFKAHWGYIHIRGVDIEPISLDMPEPKLLSSANLEFDLASPSPQRFNIDFDGDTLESISANGNALLEGLDYTLDEDVITLSSNYLSLQAVDSVVNLAINFIISDIELQATIAISDTTVEIPEPSLSPTLTSYDLNNAGNLAFSLNLDGDVLTEVRIGSQVLSEGTDYNLNGNTFILGESALSDLTENTTVSLQLVFTEADPISAQIEIKRSADPIEHPGFVYVTEDGHFGLDGNYFYTNGANSYIPFYKHEDMVTDLFTSAENLGMTTFRTWAFCDGEYYGTLPNTGLDGEVMCFQPKDPSNLSDDQRYSEATFQRMDWIIEQAREAGLKLILPLTNYWGGFGGMCQYAFWSPNIIVDNNGDGKQDPDEYKACYRTEERQRGIAPPVVMWEKDGEMVEKEDFEFLAEANAQYYGDDWSRERFKEYISYFLNRVNTISNVAYKDDPTIMMWELANEPRCIGCTEQQRADFHDWIDDISTHIKTIAPKQLVSTGTEGFDADNPWETEEEKGKDGNDFITDHSFPNIDAASFHLYPDWWGLSEEDSIDYIKTRIEKARAMGKPVYMGEYGRMIEYDPATMKEWMLWEGRNGVAMAERDRIYQEWLNIADELDLDGSLMWILSDTDFWEIESPQNAGGPYCDDTAGPLLPCDGLYNDWDRFTVYCNPLYQYDDTCDIFSDYSQKMNNKNIPIESDGSPIARINADPTPIYMNTTINFSGDTSIDTDGGTISSYAWNFGDGQNATGTNVSHQYSATGTYQVVLTITDNDGKIDTASVDVEVISPRAEGVIRTEGDQIVLADGTPFIMRGVNLQYGDNPSEKLPSIKHIAATGANIVRLQLRADTSADQLRAALDEIIANRMIAMPMYWENATRGRYQITGGNDRNAIFDGDISQEDAVSMWLEVWGEVVKDEKYRRYLMINIANEWGQNQSLWRSTYIEAVEALREGGIDVPLVIDAGDWGHNPYYFEGGSDIIKADVQSNTIFSVHGYYEWSTQSEVDTRINYLLSTDLPVIIGEFGRTNHYAGGRITQHFRIMEKAQEHNLGWIAWSWRGNGSGETMLDMSNSYDAYDLTQHGKDIVETTYGINDTVQSIETSYFE